MVMLTVPTPGALPPHGFVWKCSTFNPRAEALNGTVLRETLGVPYQWAEKYKATPTLSPSASRVETGPSLPSSSSPRRSTSGCVVADIVCVVRGASDWVLLLLFVLVVVHFDGDIVVATRLGNFIATWGGLAVVGAANLICPSRCGYLYGRVLGTSPWNGSH